MLQAECWRHTRRPCWWIPGCTTTSRWHQSVVCLGCGEARIRTGADARKHRLKVHVAVKPSLLLECWVSCYGCCFLLLLQLPIQPILPRLHLQFQVWKRHFRFVEMRQFTVPEIAEFPQSNVKWNFIDSSWQLWAPSTGRRHYKHTLQRTNIQKVKWAIPCEECRAAGCSSPFLRPWAHRSINHWYLWCMDSAMPDLQLPSQPHSITALWLVTNYTAWWQRHMCVNNLRKVLTWKCNGQEPNAWWGPIYKISYDYLTIMPKLRSTYDGRLIYKITYNEWKAFHRQDSRAKS